MLKNKIIIKNKKKHHHHHKKPTTSVVLEPATAATLVLGNGDLPRGPIRQSSKDSNQDEDEGTNSNYYIIIELISNLILQYKKILLI